MTPSKLTQLSFSTEGIDLWSAHENRSANWPVVYVLDENKRPVPNPKKLTDLTDVYVGESVSAVVRMRQHLSTPEKQQLGVARFIIDERFNKSVCLDLESHLIRWLSGDGGYRVLNRNEGITNADYYDRSAYREDFNAIFDQLRKDGVFTRSLSEIENSDLFKLSPFKALTEDQRVAVANILDGLLPDLEVGKGSTNVVQGDPGTGKTIVAIYVLKLLRDIALATPADGNDDDSLFSNLFTPENTDLLKPMKIALVIPQQSLRKSVAAVFKKTPGLSADMVMTAFEVGESDDVFDLIIVDEFHRLNQRANQPSASQNKKYAEINEKLFGLDDKSKSQLDWITEKSRNQIFLLDVAQSVRPADLPRSVLDGLVDKARTEHRHFRLVTQMRVQADENYVGYVREMLSESATPPAKPMSFVAYEFGMFDDPAEMFARIRSRDKEFGLSRMIAGYAWKWNTKLDKSGFDIVLGEFKMRWNGTQTDWIASSGSLNEVGSIHTVQGYDLNYAGVIIGPDLRYDTQRGGLFIDRKSYFDTKGKENNRTLGKKYTDRELLTFICNIYTVLMTRGIRGTYVHVVDPGLRRYLSAFIPPASS